ncbi:MAG: DUF2281 domain-containing protein [Thermosynechococcaceae cyanobacterium]
MTLSQAVLEKIQALPVDKQQQVLDFIEHLQQPSDQKPQKSLKGLWADLDIQISEEELNEVRQGAWRDFPRRLSL